MAYEPRYKNRFASSRRGGTFLNSGDYYDIAQKNGLGDEADQIVARHGGERYKEIFSGGFISDIFDVLSLDSYAMVGMLKGKSAIEGINSRESFSDSDSLGQYGLAGMGAGIIADVLVSPTTYIAPWTVVKKVPGVVAFGKGVQESVLGRVVERTTESGIKYSEREGGVKMARLAAEKIAYGFKMSDPVFREIYEKGMTESEIAVREADELIRPILSLDQKSAEAILKRDETGRFMRTPIDELQSNLDAKTFAKVAPAWQKIDELGQRLVKVGMLSKEKYEEGLGSYIKNAYEEYEKKANNRFFKSSIIGLKPVKKRSEDLTEEGMEKLGQIKDPGYLVAVTLRQMYRNAIHGEMLAKISDNFASVSKVDGFDLVPDTPRFQTGAGRISQERVRLGEVYKDVETTTKDLKLSKKLDKQVSSKIKDLLKTAKVSHDKMIQLLTKVEQNGSKAVDEVFDEGTPKLKVADSAATGNIISKIKDDVVEERSPIGATTKKGISEKITPKKREIVMKELDALKAKIDNYNKGFKAGSKATYKSIKEAQEEVISLINKNFELADRGRFLRVVKNTTSFKKLGRQVDRLKKDFVKLKEDSIDKTNKELMSAAKKNYDQAKKLISKAQDLTDIEKQSAIDSINMLQRKLDDLQIKKDALKEKIEIEKYGQLAGKYIPKEMKEMIDEMMEPMDDNLGRTIMAEFKFQKVVMSPAAHVRNILSNMILNYWKLGMGPKDFPLYAKAMKEVFSGTTTPELAEARKLGLGASSYASQEIQHLLSLEVANSFGIAKGKYAKIKEKIGGFYQKEEDVAKYAAYLFAKKKGLPPEEAWKTAEAATFNYAQVTPFVRKLRTSLFGAPFITFALKAVPATAEVIAYNPQRVAIFDKFRRAVESQSPDEEVESEKEKMPPWMREGFYFRLPFEDEHGRPMYFDATYILPFSTLMTQADNVYKTLRGENITPEQTLGETFTDLTPALNLIKQLAQNRDFYGNKITLASNTTDVQIADYMDFLVRFMAPPQISANMGGGYDFNGEKISSGMYKAMMDGESPDPKNVRNVEQELMSYIAMKVRPFDEEVQETSNEYWRKTELERMLVERGLVGNFLYEKKQPED